MKTGDRIVSWFYPRHCPVCHRILKNQDAWICPACAESLRPIGEPRCKKCGKALEKEEAEYCQDCQRTRHVYEQGIGIFTYDERMKDSLMKWKYGGRRDYGEFYGRAAAFYGQGYVKQWGIQGIIPVPLHKRKERQRGFNQAAMVAEIMGQKWNIPVYEGCLRKVTQTEAQKKLGAAQRRLNLKGSFAGTPGEWGLRRVLLVDDVYTTGSTIDAAAKEILCHGVEKIYYISIFVGKGF